MNNSIFKILPTWFCGKNKTEIITKDERRNIYDNHGKKRNSWKDKGTAFAAHLRWWTAGNQAWKQISLNAHYQGMCKSSKGHFKTHDPTACSTKQDSIH